MSEETDINELKTCIMELTDEIRRLNSNLEEIILMISEVKSKLL